jgi:putative transposase
VYYKPRAIAEADLKLMRRIDELHLEHPYYGARRLSKQLEREGLKAGPLHVSTFMGRMGIAALYRRPRTSIPARLASIYPYLLNGLAIERPNQVWASDGARNSPVRSGSRYSRAPASRSSWTAKAVGSTTCLSNGCGER